jgi:hypothetical protein
MGACTQYTIYGILHINWWPENFVHGRHTSGRSVASAAELQQMSTHSTRCRDAVPPLKHLRCSIYKAAKISNIISIGIECSSDDGCSDRIIIMHVTACLTDLGFE